MKKYLFILIVLIRPLTSNSQDIDTSKIFHRNTIYLEALGQGLYNSVSFDRLYKIDHKVKTSISAGLTIIPSSGLFVVATPISYNYLIGQNKHHLELGLGFTPMFIRSGNITASYSDGNSNNVTFTGSQNMFFSFFTPKIGYRYQRPEGGFFFRLTFTPPIAGINIYGNTKGQGQSMSDSYNEFFTSAAFFGSPVFPWGGLSIGWTLKK